MWGVRRRLAVAATALTVIVGAEAGAAALDPHLPAPRIWHSVEADVKVGQMDRLGQADLALVGASVLNGGADPSVIGERLGRSVYNAGLSAGFIPITSLWAEEVVLPRLHPDVLVLGLISFDVHAHDSHPLFEDALRTSPGGRAALGTEGLVDRLDRALGERSALWRHRRSLRSPSTVLDALQDDVEPPDPEFGPIGPLGRARYGGEVPSLADADRPADAGLPVTQWRPDPGLVERVRTLVRRAAADGTSTVLVSMPVSQRYVDRHPNGEADQQAFHAVLEGIARGEGVSLIDMDVMRDPGRYLDQVHLDDAAAAEFSEALAAALAAELGAP